MVSLSVTLNNEQRLPIEQQHIIHRHMMCKYQVYSLRCESSLDHFVSCRIFLAINPVALANYHLKYSHGYYSECTPTMNDHIATGINHVLGVAVNNIVA